GLPYFRDGFFEPDPDDERMRCPLGQAHDVPTRMSMVSSSQILMTNECVVLSGKLMTPPRTCRLGNLLARKRPRLWAACAQVTFSLDHTRMGQTIPGGCLSGRLVGVYADVFFREHAGSRVDRASLVQHLLNQPNILVELMLKLF